MKRSVRAAMALGWILIQAPSLAGSDQVPGDIEDRPVALVGATIYPVDSPPVPGGTLVFAGGKIVAIGSGVIVPPGARVIDAAGKRVYPAMIDSSTQIGLVEIDAVRATRDGAEVGELNPNVRAEVSVNPDSELIPVARANGVALAASVPAGGLVSGTSALLRLDGWTWEEMVVEAPLGVHVHWPRMTAESGDDAEAARAKKERDRMLRAVQDLFAEARAYLKASLTSRAASREVDLRLEALLPVVLGKRPVFLHCDGEREIRAAVAWARGDGLRAVLVSGAAAAAAATLLRENDVPVIYGPVHSLPRRGDLMYDDPFSAPGRLAAAGVKLAIASFDDSNARNLPYHAATAAAHGLPAEEALRAVTLHPAQILGVADRYGSLAPGKSATLMVTDGDPLEIVTHVEQMWIDGRPVDLTNRHTRLHRKYGERIRRVLTERRF
jgi:imidazolonepropionase-like amidohydrolase